MQYRSLIIFLSLIIISLIVSGCGVEINLSNDTETSSASQSTEKDYKGITKNSSQITELPDPKKDMNGFLQATSQSIFEFWKTEFEVGEEEIDGIGLKTTRDWVKPRMIYVKGGSIQSECLEDAESGKKAIVTPDVVNAFYCDHDNNKNGTIYLMPGIFESDIFEELGAKTNRASLAAIIAHEYGHHIQNITGIKGDIFLPALETAWVERDERSFREIKAAYELGADCLAGMWFHEAYVKKTLTEQDFKDATDAFIALGDDTIATTMGEATWELDHGSSTDRKKWLERGYRDGKKANCFKPMDIAVDRLLEKYGESQ